MLNQNSSGARMPKVYGSYKTGADIYRDTKSGKYYILEWNPQTRETYKKFINFKPIAINSDHGKSSKTLKKSALKKSKTQKKQKGGLAVPGEMQQDVCQQQVLNTPSYKSILAQLRQPESQEKYLATDIQKIRDEYTTNFRRNRLVDVIYNAPSQGINGGLGKLIGMIPKMCWDHGINNSESITGGALGIHVYIADISLGQIGPPQWQLVGVFNRG